MGLGLSTEQTMSTARTMIRVENLTKNYGAHRAVDGISFEVPSGEVLGFLGPNGAGKTTTMKILTCFIAPTSGSVRVGDIDVLDRSIKVRELIGYLPEDTPLYQELTTLELLEFASAIRQVDSARRDKRIHEISEVCGLYEVLDQPIGELSKGFRQRVGLAQAMIHDPPILILDEPTSGLDPNQIVDIRELIKAIGKEKTVILSTHILPEVQATCGRVIIIHEGKLVADGSPQELAHQDASNRVRILIDPLVSKAEEVKEKLSGILNVTKVASIDGEDKALGFLIAGSGQEDLRPSVFGCAKDNGWILLEMQQQTASLEDVFRKLTKE
jgi:ABC-2 type transport system ATP-binding protein